MGKNTLAVTRIAVTADSRRYRPIDEILVYISAADCLYLVRRGDIDTIVLAVESISRRTRPCGELRHYHWLGSVIVARMRQPASVYGIVLRRVWIGPRSPLG